MVTLLGDGWFYISALGFLVSSSLFLYLLGQYRCAVEATEDSEDSESPVLTAGTAAIDHVPAPVVTPIVAPPVEKKDDRTLVLPPQTAASSGASAPAPAPAPALASAPETSGGTTYTGPDRRRDPMSTTGGISPAVVYLQNIKSQMEKFDKEISNLKSLASQQAAQGELVLKRLAEISDSVRAAAAPPMRAAQLPQPVRSVNLSLEPSVPEPSVPAPAPAAVQAAPAAVLNLEPPKPAVEAPAVLAAPAPAPAEIQPEPVPSETTLEAVVPSAQIEIAPPAAVIPASAPAVESPAAPAVIQRDVQPFTKPPAAVPPASAPPTPDATVILEALPMTPPATQPPAEAPKPRKGPVWPV